MKIIVSLTTTPFRLNRIEPCLYSLLNQKTNCQYEVHLNIPNIYKKTNEPYILSDYIKNNTDIKLKIFNNLDDQGPITKIYYTIDRINNPDDIIIVCDDDMIYNEKLVDEHVQNQKLYDNCAIGYSGLYIARKEPQEFFNDRRDEYVTSIFRNAYVNYLEHYKTVSYKRKYFQDDFKQFVSESGWNDDVTLGAYMSLKNIKRMVTFYKHDRPMYTLSDWETYGLGKNGSLTFPLIKDISNADIIDGANLFRLNKDDEGYYKFAKNGLFYFYY
jgi:hypothetical protein